MGMKKPKTLYSYNVHHEFEKHEITEDCMPVLVEHRPNGTYYRCRSDRHDFHGYDSTKAAKIDEVRALRRDILHLSQLENKLLALVLKDDTSLKG
jgi:hypothetical protein